MKREKNTKVMGFDGYRVYAMDPHVFGFAKENLYPWYYVSTWNYFNPTVYLSNGDFPETKEDESKKNVFKERGTVTEDSKVWIHNCCKLSKNIVYSKYKKAKSPWEADVVVVPDPDKSNVMLVHKEVMVAVNDEDKCIVLSDLNDTDEKDKIDFTGYNGVSLRDILGTTVGEVCDGNNSYAVAVSRVLNARFDGVCTAVDLSSDALWIADWVENVIPKDKIVYEDTILKAMEDDTNRPDLASLSNIYDMLVSDDKDTQAVGLKAMANMNYSSYPISCEFILQQAFQNKSTMLNNPAWSTTAVHYMKNVLKSGWSRNWPFNLAYRKSITQKDWDLLQEIVAWRRSSEEDTEYAKNRIFCYWGFIDANNKPIIKDEK